MVMFNSYVKLPEGTFDHDLTSFYVTGTMLRFFGFRNHPQNHPRCWPKFLNSYFKGSENYFLIQRSDLPSGKRLHNYGKIGKSPFPMGKSVRTKWQFSIANCNKLPEGKRNQSTNRGSNCDDHSSSSITHLEYPFDSESSSFREDSLRTTPFP